MLTTTKHIASAISAFLLSITLLAFTGCLITSNTTDTQSGAYVPESTFNQITVGKTTMAWVQATLGEPTTKANDDDRVIWTYSYVEHHDSSGAIFLIFGGHSATDTPHKAYVEFKDGIVTNDWRA